nr:hypothetical protein [Rickettsia endosymbiont of Ceutorhynchus assimilis]
MDTQTVMAMQQRRICAERGNLEKYSHPEFISGSLLIDAETSSA